MKEYSIWEILKNAWTQYKKNFLAILIITLIVYFPLNLISNLSSLKYAIHFNGLIGIIAFTAICLIIKSSLNGKFISVKEAFNQALRKWVAIILTDLLLFIALIGLPLLYLLLTVALFLITSFVIHIPSYFLALLCVIVLFPLLIPFIIFSNYWLFTNVVVVFHNKNFREALNYSETIVRDRWWKVAGYAIALVIMQLWVATTITVFTLSFLPQNHSFINVIIASISNILYAYFSVAWIIFFLNFDSTKKVAS